ncbi:hypothetical protein ACFSC6_18460 [Rufibacter sediminis]|uniref:Uncharacterized protein n=1 Tax=Rufibacter sediminis TaxID=2762756 RepID=A0ABR6VQN2_9BACT|nr:hypothetical protein [Rufibacter sediminis]MBC3539509.1 hypothetical protein [Rufibacter sediminis]
MKQYLSNDPESRLSFLPTPFQDKDVEVFFPGEKPTDTAFVKVAILEKKVMGNAVAYSELVNAIKTEAKLQGMDAVLLLNKGQNTRLVREGVLSQVIAETIAGRDLEPEYSSVTTHELAGVGIKYKKNLQYLPEYVKSKDIFLLKDGQETHMGSVAIDHEGIPRKASISSADDQTIYEQYIQPYDVNHLLKEEGPRWKYSAVQGRVKKRMLLSPTDGTTLKTIKIKYNDALLPAELEMRSGTFLLPETILFSYNEQRKPVEKRVLREKQLYLRDVFSYNENGKLESILHYKVQDGQEVPFLKTVYEYYHSLASAE